MLFLLSTLTRDMNLLERHIVAFDIIDALVTLKMHECNVRRIPVLEVFSNRVEIRERSVVWTDVEIST